VTSGLSAAARRPGAAAQLATAQLATVSGSPSGGGTGDERYTLGMRGDVLLGVALQASLMAECFADGAGEAEGRVGVSKLVSASHIGEYAADGDSGLCHTGRSS